MNKVAPAPLYTIFKMLKSEIFSDLRVCLPGTISGVDSMTGTVSVTIGVMQNVAKLNFPGGVDFHYPQLTGVPVFTVQGGGVGAVMPVKIGDSCLVVFSDRAIDSWMSTGQPNPLPSFRMHNIADGFALVGPNTLLKPLLTSLKAGDGGLCETAVAVAGTGARVGINPTTHLINIANGVAGVNSLLTILTTITTALTTMNTALEALNTVLAADSGLNGTSHTALATANAAIAAASVSLGTAAANAAGLLE